MYIEDKSGGLVGPCRVGRVVFSKSGSTLRYGERSFQSLKGLGFKANYIDIESGQAFWISGPRKDGADGLYGRITQPDDVDADVAEEYWLTIRGASSFTLASERPRPVFTNEVDPASGEGRKAARIARTTLARNH